MADNDFTTEIMDKVIEEIYQLGGEMNVDFESPTAEEYKDLYLFLYLFYSKLVPATAEHYASMLQDIKKAG